MITSYVKATLTSKALFILLLLFGFATISFADVVIKPNTIISSSTTYSDKKLDMSKGSFIIQDGATLTIEKCVIKGLLKDDKPYLFSVNSGKLVMKENEVEIETKGIKPHPLSQSLHYVMTVNIGNVDLYDNHFSIDQSFTAGLLLTNSAMMPTTGYNIVKNRFEKFHGVLYLVAVRNVLVSKNKFDLNSYGHIVLIGSKAEISNNKIYFSGNDHLGNSIDLINADHVLVSNNSLYTPTCHGIYSINSRNVTIDGNRITGGITHAINVYTSPEGMSESEDYVTQLATAHRTTTLGSHDITISNNYMSQNRFGIAASDVNDMKVVHNIFIQRFETDAERKFWTDNNNLFKNVSNLEWRDNLYKEAFTQSNEGDNKKSLKFVTFPKSGGVDL